MESGASASPLFSERKRTVVFLCMCAAIALWAGPFRPGVVLGESMAPAFRSGQVFLMSRIRDAAALRHGDVVLVDIGGQIYLKRVHALGGESVWGVTTTESGGPLDWIVPRSEVGRVRKILRRYHSLGEVVKVEVPPGYAFVLGDSRGDSYDSRHFGPVPLEAVRGRVVVSRLFWLWGPRRPGGRVAMARERGTSNIP